MSILDWFRGNRREEDDGQPEEPKSSRRAERRRKMEKEIPDTENDTGPGEELLMDLWASQEEHPEDMKAAKLFLPAVRQRLRSHESKCRAAQIMAEKAGMELDDGIVEPVEIQSEDAKCMVYVPADRMLAFICILPPIGEGIGITVGDIMDILEENKVTYGIDQEKVSAIAAERSYGVLFTVARGIPQTNGKDGLIEDHFSRQEDVGLKQDEKGNVDHKSLRRYYSIKSGELICEITPPTEGEDGMDVTGRVLKAKAGKQPKIPQGKNTALSEDGTQLLAAMDGDISFHNSAFHVQRVLKISGSVDNAVGNLDYNGDIVIQEDVKSGFKVCATGDIIVRGMVEGATLCAGGNIEVAKGMNGNIQGLLEAGGNVKLTFMENTNVTCEQDVYASTVINSNVTCGGSLFVTEGKGILIGGSIVAGKSVEAKRIGNKSGCENKIKIGGRSMNEEDDVEYLQRKIKENADELEEMLKNIAYLEGRDLSPEKQAVLDNLKVQSLMRVDRMDALSAKLEEVENTTPDFSECRVSSEVIYPMTKITLDYAKFTIKETTDKCVVYYQDGELKMGTV